MRRICALPCIESGRQGEDHRTGATRCEHLPQAYEVSDESRVLYDHWRVVRTTWTTTQLHGSLLDAASIRQLLNWMADMCDALSALHHCGCHIRTCVSKTMILTQSSAASC